MCGEMSWLTAFETGDCSLFMLASKSPVPPPAPPTFACKSFVCCCVSVVCPSSSPYLLAVFFTQHSSSSEERLLETSLLSYGLIFFINPSMTSPCFNSFWTAVERSRRVFLPSSLQPGSGFLREGALPEKHLAYKTHS